MPRALPTGDSPHEGGRPADGPVVQRMLNVPLLIGTLVVVAVLVPAARFWHSRQLRQVAEAFLDRAGDLEAQEDWTAAADYLRHYLQLDSGHTDARIRLAMAYDRSGDDAEHKKQAINYYYRALGMAPADEQPALRLRLVELLLELGEFISAETEAKKLLAADDKDALAKRLLALSLHGRFRAGRTPAGEYTGANAVNEIFEQALALNPGDVRLSAELAHIYRREENLLNNEKRGLTGEQRAKLADEVMDRMVHDSPDGVDAILARCQYRFRNNLPDGEADLESALKLGPDDVRVRLLAAAFARQQAHTAAQNDSASVEVRKHRDLAGKHYQYVIEHLDPSNEIAHLGLGEIYLARGERDRVIEAWQHGLKERGDTPSLELNLRLAKALIDEGEMDRAGKILGGLDKLVERNRTRLPAPARTSVECKVALLRARWLATKGDLRGAIPVASRVARMTTDENEAFQAWVLLARTHGLLQQPDQSAAAYERVLRLRPGLTSVRLAAAQAWEAAENPKAAIRLYRHALDAGDSAETWLSLAHARLKVQANLPSQERQWQEFDEALAEAKNPEGEESLANAWRVNLLEASYLAIRAEEQGKLEEGIRAAGDLLRQTEKNFPASAEFLRQLAYAYQRLGAAADADRAAENFQRLAAKSVPAYVLRSQLLLRRKEYDQARQVLREGLAAVPRQSQSLLQETLAQIDIRQGRLEEAMRDLAKLHETDRSNVRLVRQLAELALETRNAKEAQRWEKELQRLEGPDGCAWRCYKARRLLALTEGPDDPRVGEADQLRMQIESRRPAWSATHLLHGLILQRRGKLQQAVDEFQLAIRAGERRVAVYELLIRLLYRMKRFDEADRYLAQLKGRLPSSRSLSSLEISVAAKQGELDRAVEVARHGVQSRPDDHLAHVWLGQMLLANGNTQEAEDAFRRAVQLAPTDELVYRGQFTFYQRTNQPELARESLQKLAENAELTGVQRALVLAQGHEALGDRQQAEVHYGKAVQLAPNDAGIHLHMATFLTKAHQYPKAEQSLRRVLQLSLESSVARRKLAACLAVQGGKEKWREAQRLLTQSGDDDGSNRDQRLQAMLLAGRGGKENLAKARQLLEKLVADSTGNVDGERLLLVRLYEAEGKLQAARQQFVTLVGRADPDPSYLALFIDMLLRNDSYDEARVWLNTLDDVAPDDLTAAELRARWLHAQGKAADIEPLVEPLAEKLRKQVSDDPHREAQLARTVGQLYSNVQQHEAAERWYRRLVGVVPEAYGLLATSMARQDRVSEAIRVCLEAAESDSSPQPAITLAMALMNV